MDLQAHHAAKEQTVTAQPPVPDSQPAPRPASAAPTPPPEAAEPVTVTLHRQDGGPTLGTATAPVIEVDGHLFKDLARTGELLPYEDWRLPATERAADLAERLGVEQIAGLMLYSPHQAVPNPGVGPFPGTYGGQTFQQAGVPAWTLTDQQRAMVTDDHLRHVLVTTLESARTAACWVNEIQALAESQPLGVPVSISSDPRHGAGSGGAEFSTSAAAVSRWPEGLGMAALLDPQRVAEFGAIASAEYRALGITTALGPQIDIATDPRWMRLQDTWGPHSALVADYTRAFCDAMQTTPPAACQPGAAFGLPAAQESATDPGWGHGSVATMVKHWPGGGSGEAGRDAHYGFGKFAVYPGGNEAEHLRAFTEAAFDLEGATRTAAAVMPYYTISWRYRTPQGEVLNDSAAVAGPDGVRPGPGQAPAAAGGAGSQVPPRANSYNRAIVHDMLREQAGYQGVVCTDWGITADPDDEINSFGQRCYGVEDLSVAQRHALAIDNGVDQFGGNSEAAPVIEAYRLLAERDGQEAALARLRASARRLLAVFFRAGLFENPYLDPQLSEQVVGARPFVEAGRAAQRDSLILLKNQPAGAATAGSPANQSAPAPQATQERQAGGGVVPVLPLGETVRRVWVPTRHLDASIGFFRQPVPPQEVDPYQAGPAALERAQDPREADAAVVFIESPLSEPYSLADRQAGGNGYLPLSLQWGTYTAQDAREHSLASGDYRETEHPDRSVRGKTATVYNAGDLDLVRRAREVMGDKPVVVVLRMHNPAVLAEVEPLADAVVVDLGVEQDLVWELLRGRFTPRGLLPLALPASMEAVERHCEDLPFDYAPYTDAAGHAYGFGFGMDWDGVIRDERTARYRVEDGRAVRG